MNTVLTLSRAPTVNLLGKQTPPALFAETELRRYLELILDKATRHDPARGIRLVIDAQSGLSDEGYGWELDDGGIRIVAGGDLGLVFAVYAFLRDVCGCRFYGLGPDGEHVPRLQELTTTITPTRRKPKLWYRSIQFYYFEHPTLYQQVIDWMAKNGFNYVLYHLGTEHDATLMKEQVDPQTGERLFPVRNGPSMFDEEYFNQYLLPDIGKRGLKLDFNHHNLCYWVPPAKHAREHPEWFAELDGKRAASFTQLCLCTSNREMTAALVSRVKEFLRANPDVRIVGVVPEDGRGMCQCEACRALDVNPDDAFTLDRDYRDPANQNHSLIRRYARLLNEVARSVRQEFPNVLVSGLAYVDLQWPPSDMEFEDNVSIQVAVYWRDGARPLAAQHTSTTNRCFFDLIKQWRALVRGPLLLYEYYMGMGAQRSLPYPMTNVISEDWRNLARIPVEGATIQCTADCHEAYALNLLAFSKCAWGEPLDADRLIADYALSVFGRAGDALRPLFDAMFDVATERRSQESELLPDGKNIMHFWQRLHAVQVWDRIERAAKLASNDRERAQVDRFGRYLKYCELAAQAMATQTQIEQIEASDVKRATELRCRLVESEISAVIAYLDNIKLVGWVLPRSSAGWEADLNRHKQQIIASQRSLS